MFRPETFIMYFTLLMVMPSTASTQIQSDIEPSNMQVNNSRYLPSLFILNYSNKSRDEQFHLFNANDAENWQDADIKKKEFATSITPIIPPTTTTRASTVTPTTITAEKTTISKSTTELSTTELTTTELSTTELTTTELITTTQLTPPPRIINGEEVKRGEYPFVALIALVSKTNISPNRKYRHWSCTGTLISNDFVLTTTACGTTWDNEKFAVVLGHSSLLIEDDFSKKYILAKKYIQDHTLGLLLIPSVNFAGNILPACIRGRTPDDRTIMAVGGDGTKDHYFDYIRLLKSNFVLYPNLRCDGVNDTRGCAGVPGFRREDKCQTGGHQGGPIFVTNPQSECKFSVIGVISHSQMQCGGGDKPVRFTHLGPYLGWIKKVMNDPYSATDFSTIPTLLQDYYHLYTPRGTRIRSVFSNLPRY